MFVPNTLGVREYWQFDPEGDYLDPVLKGGCLNSDGGYRELVLDQRDGVLCHATLLGLEFRLDGDRLRLFDPERGRYLATYKELVQSQGDAEALIRELEERLHRI